MKCPKCDCENIRLRRTYNCEIDKDGNMLEVENYAPDDDIYFCDDCDYKNSSFKEFK